MTNEVRSEFCQDSEDYDLEGYLEAVTAQEEEEEEAATPCCWADILLSQWPQNP